MQGLLQEVLREAKGPRGSAPFGLQRRSIQQQIANSKLDYDSCPASHLLHNILMLLVQRDRLGVLPHARLGVPEEFQHEARVASPFHPARPLVLLARFRSNFASDSKQCSEAIQKSAHDKRMIV